MTAQETEATDPHAEVAPGVEVDLTLSRRIGLDWFHLGLLLVLLLAVVLRAWGIEQGLPFIYNPDERVHFVPRAVRFFTEGYNPHYFVNPPAFTYFVHLILAVWYRGGNRAIEAFTSNPSQVFLIARLAAAALGVMSVWLLYLTGSRMWDRGVGLLAAGMMAVAFLPVSYSHQALNDAPTLVPVALSLFGTAGVLRRGRLLDYLVAGVGLGLGTATKYPAAIVVLPLLGATVADIRSKRRWKGPFAGLALATAAAVAAFVAANPYSILDHKAFLTDVNSISFGYATGGADRLGQAQQNGILYYLWTLTWGLGWVPSAAALGGAVLLLKDDPRKVAILVPAPILFVWYMGSQGRYFGRWIMPILPVLILLAAYAVSWLLSHLAPMAGRLAPAAASVIVATLLAQGLVTSVHADVVLTRADTRALARRWIFQHVPSQSLMVVEPIYLLLKPTGEDPGGVHRQSGRLLRWTFVDVRTAVIRARLMDRKEALPQTGSVHFERLLRPGLIDLYEREAVCWVVTGNSEWGRTFATPREVPEAIAYYRKLRRRAVVSYHVSPYGLGKEPEPFNFDWSTEYYPLGYVRPGPEITVYHLTGGRCG